MKREEMINLGQLVRERKGNVNTVLVGFSTFEGSVIASKSWVELMEKMNVPPARKDSWDNILHNLDKENEDKKTDVVRDKFIIFRPYRHYICLQ